MQSLPLVAVDMMSAGLPASASTTKTGQDGIFAAQLVAALQGQTTTTSQTKALGEQESTLFSFGPSSVSDDVPTAQLTEAANSLITGQPYPARDDLTAEFTEATEFIEAVNPEETNAPPAENPRAFINDLIDRIKVAVNANETNAPSPENPRASIDDLIDRIKVAIIAKETNAPSPENPRASINDLIDRIKVAVNTNETNASSTEGSQVSINDLIDRIKVAVNANEINASPENPQASINDLIDRIKVAVNANEINASPENPRASINDLIDRIKMAVNANEINAPLPENPRASIDDLIDQLKAAVIAKETNASSPENPQASINDLIDRIKVAVSTKETNTPPPENPQASINDLIDQLAEAVIAKETNAPPFGHSQASINGLVAQLKVAVSTKETNTPPLGHSQASINGLVAQLKVAVSTNEISAPLPENPQTSINDLIVQIAEAVNTNETNASPAGQSQTSINDLIDQLAEAVNTDETNAPPAAGQSQASINDLIDQLAKAVNTNENNASPAGQSQPSINDLIDQLAEAVNTNENNAPPAAGQSQASINDLIVQLSEAVNANENHAPPAAGQYRASINDLIDQLAEAVNTEENNAPPAAGQSQASINDLIVQLAEAVNANENNAPPAAGQSRASINDLIDQLAEAVNTEETNLSLSDQIPAVDDAIAKGDLTDDLTSAASLNNSAGAANLGILPVHWTGTEIRFTPSQHIVRAQDRESVVCQMLNAITSNAITSVSNGPMATGQTTNPASQTQGATIASTNIETAAQTFPQAFSVETPQPLVMKTPPVTSPETTGTISVPSANSGISNGNMPIDSTTLQSQTTGSMVADPAPAAEATGLTGPTPAAIPSVTSQAQSVPPQTITEQNTTAPKVEQIVQNQYGQIITIHQANVSEEMAATMVDGSTLLNTATNTQNLDINSNYLHSHLPNDAPKNVDKESTGQQQDTAKDNQQKGASTANTFANGQTQPDQLSNQSPQSPVGSENQPLMFSQQQIGTPPVNTAPPADDSTLQLPSGLIVPGATVVDQMVAHFSVNRRLESGIVNLKLTPQELGELRMEIKITQDNVKAHIVAQNPQAQEMISLHLPRLREALEQQGLHLQQVEVTIAANDNASREQFQGQAGQQQLNQPMQNRGSHPVFALNPVEETVEAAQAVNNLSVLA